MKNVIFWGAGSIGKQCLVQHTEVEPVFIIDSFYKGGKLFGKDVRHPDEVKDWRKYFIVITVKHPKEIENYLMQKDLHKRENYLWYQDFFMCKVQSVAESTNLFQAYMDVYKEEESPIFFSAPVVEIRGRAIFHVFLQEYVKKRLPRRVLLFSEMCTVSYSEISKQIGCETFSRPDITNWNGQCWDGSEDIRGIDDLTAEENEWLRVMENRKLSSDREKAILDSKKVYCYYDNIIKMLHPAEIIIWSGWSRECYILGHIAEVRGIPYGYMEYGWIPGTYQFDLRGIAGQGEYAVKQDALEKIIVSVEDISKLQQIKDYVIENRLDTRTFLKTEADDAELKKIISDRKTVLLVGMDEKGMCMNPKDSYWEQYISSAYHSMEEVLADLMQICADNGYNLIFKPHPGEQPLEINKFDRSKMIYVKDASIDHLIQICDAAVSMASAVDYKVLMYGKALVQIGITGLRGKKCTYEVKERSCLEEQVKAALRDGMTEQQKRNYDIFLARLLKTHLWDDMSDKKISYGLTLDTDFFEVKYESSCICTD